MYNSRHIWMGGPAEHMRTLGNGPNCSVNSVQEACDKCFEVHILKFEILQTTWRNKTKNIKMLDLLMKNWKLSLMFQFFHVICKISNFNMLTAKHLAQACCTELTLHYPDGPDHVGSLWPQNRHALTQFENVPPGLFTTYIDTQCSRICNFRLRFHKKMYISNNLVLDFWEIFLWNGEIVL